MSNFNLQDPDFDPPVSTPEPTPMATTAYAMPVIASDSFLGGVNSKIAFYIGLGSTLTVCSAIGFFTLLYFFFTK